MIIAFILASISLVFLAIALELRNVISRSGITALYLFSATALAMCIVGYYAATILPESIFITTEIIAGALSLFLWYQVAKILYTYRYKKKVSLTSAYKDLFILSGLLVIASRPTSKKKKNTNTKGNIKVFDLAKPSKTPILISYSKLDKETEVGVTFDVNTDGAIPSDRLNLTPPGLHFRSSQRSNEELPLHMHDVPKTIKVISGSFLEPKTNKIYCEGDILVLDMLQPHGIVTRELSLVVDVHLLPPKNYISYEEV